MQKVIITLKFKSKVKTFASSFLLKNKLSMYVVRSSCSEVATTFRTEIWTRNLVLQSFFHTQNETSFLVYTGPGLFN